MPQKIYFIDNGIPTRTILYFLTIMVRVGDSDDNDRHVTICI